MMNWLVKVVKNAVLIHTCFNVYNKINEKKKAKMSYFNEREEKSPSLKRINKSVQMKEHSNIP